MSDSGIVGQTSNISFVSKPWHVPAIRILALYHLVKWWNLHIKQSDKIVTETAKNWEILQIVENSVCLLKSRDKPELQVRQSNKD